MNTTPDSQTLAVLRELPPLMPQFLRKRRMGLPALDWIMAKMATSRPLFFALVGVHEVGARYGRPDGAVTLAEMRASEPYITTDFISEPIAQLIAAGHIRERKGGMLVLSPETRVAIDTSHFEATNYVATKTPLPAEDLERLASDLEKAASAVKANPELGQQPGSVLRGRLYFERYGVGKGAMVRIEQAIFELWGARDDSHLKAWRDADMEGPPLELLSHVYEGVESESALIEAIKPRQSLEALETNLEWLTEREMLTRHGDELHLTPKGVLAHEDIERETDRVYFSGWPFTLLEATWTKDSLQQLVNNL